MWTTPTFVAVQLMTSSSRLTRNAGMMRIAGAPKTPQVGCREYAVTIASRFYFSHTYKLVYFLTIVASVICVVWTGVNNWRIPPSPVFVSLEIGVSCLLVFEVLLRMTAFRRKFWDRWCNVFDFIALVLSLVSVFMYFNEEGVMSELEEVATDVLLAFRNAIQYMRLAIFLKNRSEQRGGARGSEIDFDTVVDSDDYDYDEDEILNLVSENQGAGAEKADAESRNEA